MCKLSLVGVAWVFFILMIASGTPTTSICPLASNDGDEVQVRKLLADVGTKNGVTFTIEEALLKGGASDRIRSFRHLTPPEGSSLKAVLDDLSQSVANLTWYVDSNNPKIIHVLDDRLLHHQGYALDRVLDDIDFSGTVIELIDRIASQGISVSSGGPASSDDLLSMDGVTKVQARGKGLRVRDVLSDFVPLEGRGPILWFSVTHLDGGDQTTYVRFQGAPPKNR